MDSVDIDRIKYMNPGKETQARILKALNNVSPTEQSWERARQLLSGTKWRFAGDTDLDDTADTAYSHSFSPKDGDQVIAGIAYQQLQGVRMTIRRVDKTNDMCDIVMSGASADRLNMLAPSMKLLGFTHSAGHDVVGASR